MSGPAEVGVIYGHGIPGTYINSELASYERSCTMETNGKENFGGEIHCDGRSKTGRKIAAIFLGDSER